MTRLAVVTGANRGIGREVARQLAGRGFTVMLGARDAAQAEEAARAIGGDARGSQLDVTDEGSVRALADRLREEHQSLAVLVNNAGIDYDTDQRAATADIDRVRAAIEVNLLGAWRTAVALAPLMGSGGRIVNVSSGAGSFGESTGGGAPGYSVSKAALDMLTVKLAADLRDRGVLVNAVCPGWVATDMGGGGGRPVEKGAAGVVWAADLADDGPTGGFFRDGKPIPW